MSVTMMWQGFKIGNDSLDIASSVTEVGTSGVQAFGSFGTNTVEKERTYVPKLSELDSIHIALEAYRAVNQ
jgi:hypothetical protein